MSISEYSSQEESLLRTGCT